MTAFAPPSDWASRPSPNFGTRKQPTTAIVLHADASSSIDSSIDWVTRQESHVSYHIMIGRTGKVFLIVSPDHVAWHAGTSKMGARENVNGFSIGVCLSNRNDGHEEHPQPQLDAAVKVCALLCKHYAISSTQITTHALVATPPGRKTDPKMVNLAAFQYAVQEQLKAMAAQTLPQGATRP